MKPGIYKDIDINDYHSNKEWISSTGLKRAKKSLKDFWFYQNGYYDNEFKRAFDFGNAFELALLDPDGFEKKVANEADIYAEIIKINPEVQKFRATKQYKEWHEKIKSEGKYIIADKGYQSFQTIEQMLSSCYQDAVINKLIQNIDYQTSIYWIDKQTGLQLKTRPDFCKIKKNVIVDVKTTDDASPEKFMKNASDYDYPLQACIQMDGVLQSGLMPNVDFYYWLVVEKKAPYSAVIYHFAPEDIKWIMEEYRLILRKIAQAQNENKWPSYQDRADNKFGILRLKISPWYSIYNEV